VSESYLHQARHTSNARLRTLKNALGEAETLITDKACVYATGSFGRGEAGPDSDLDLFIVVPTAPEMKEGIRIEKRLLDGIEEIKLKCHLITAVEENGIAKFDGGGKYLKVHTINDFTSNLGSQEDDAKNTFTGRLLMLLESKPLLGEEIYRQALSEVISAYFRDFADNSDQFAPAFLINDILRMWRTFCVNYEYSRAKGTNKSKIKNLKLKYSRMLTCYSAIIYLLVVYSRSGTVTPANIRDMVAITPTERIEIVSDEAFWQGGTPHGLTKVAGEALGLYSDFLDLVHKDDDYVEDQFHKRQKELRESSHRFGSKLAEIVGIVTNNAAHPGLYRFVLI
jgi:predicted nucleotidyltransferase